jgi:hypothetical protein
MAFAVTSHQLSGAVLNRSCDDARQADRRSNGGLLFDEPLYQPMNAPCQFSGAALPGAGAHVVKRSRQQIEGALPVRCAFGGRLTASILGTNTAHCAEHHRE